MGCSAALMFAFLTSDQLLAVALVGGIAYLLHTMLVRGATENSDLMAEVMIG